MQRVEEIFKELVLLNEEGDHDEMADLMYDLQSYLVKHQYLTDQLFPTEKGSEELQELTDIFLEIRREYQSDEEKIQDFSYLAVAWDWLYSRGVPVNDGRNMIGMLNG